MRVRGRPVAWSAVGALVVLAGGAAVTSALTAPTHPSAAPRTGTTTLPTAVFTSPPLPTPTTLPVPAPDDLLCDLYVAAPNSSWAKLQHGVGGAVGDGVVARRLLGAASGLAARTRRARCVRRR